MHRIANLLWACLPGFFAFSCRQKPPTTPSVPKMDFFVGAYTDQTGPSGQRAKGITRLVLDSSGTALLPPHTDSGLVNPSFLTLSADRRFLYAVEETGPDGPDSTGHLRAYAVEANGLRLLNRQSTHGFAPCHVQTDRANRFAFVANYGGGVALFPIGPDGSLAMASDVQRPAGKGPHPRQDTPHPHAAFLAPDERFLYVPDLGADRIYIYQIDTVAGRLLPAEPAFCALPPGAGPRHLVFHPTLPFVYVINELDNTITQLQRDAENGHLSVLASTPTLPEGAKEASFCADIHLTPDGRYLYGSNRGHDSLVGFRIDPQTGQLSLIGHTPVRGSFPRNFAIHPDGKWLLVANQKSDNIVAYRIQDDGTLSFQWEKSSPSPVCIQFF